MSEKWIDGILIQSGMVLGRFEWEAMWREQECKHDELWDF